jgi:hypothetical protein
MLASSSLAYRWTTSVYTMVIGLDWGDFWFREEKVGVMDGKQSRSSDLTLEVVQSQKKARLPAWSRSWNGGGSFVRSFSV